MTDIASRPGSIRVTPEVELRYGCDVARLPLELQSRFIELEHDAASRAFVEEAMAAPHGPIKTWIYSQLRRVMSDYDAYGLLDLYPMHLLSTAQLERLIGSVGRARLLDIGAGSGGVTTHAAKLFEHVSATEASSMLRRRLRARGYEVIEHDFTYAAPPERSERYDVVTCFNVLDRCSHPRTLLRNASAALKAEGKLVLSVPLPLKPHVHVGRYTVDQEERLPEAKAMWELGVGSVAGVLRAEGLMIEAVSRAPYLCRGDSTSAIYVLDAAVFVCRLA